MIPVLTWKGVALSAAIFSVSMAGGYQAAYWIDPTTLREEFSNVVGDLADLPAFVLFLAIFLNNAIKTFVVMLLGLGLGLIPVVFLIINGVLLGVVISLVGPSGTLLAGLLPHGIIEIPAVLISSAMGMHLGATIWAKVRGKDINIAVHVTMAIRSYLIYVGPALLAAAFIEAYVTPLAIRSVGG